MLTMLATLAHREGECSTEVQLGKFGKSVTYRVGTRKLTFSNREEQDFGFLTTVNLNKEKCIRIISSCT
jgi:hypothetical protein